MKNSDMPEGMKPWSRHDTGPSDWDGGPVWCEPGAWLRDPTTYGWKDVIGYTPTQTPSTQDARATGLVELAVRCEQATGADDNLAMEIIRLDYDTPGGIGLGVNYDPDLWMERNGIDPTASLDAAMTLVPEGHVIGSLNQRTLYDITQAIETSVDLNERAAWMAWVHIDTNDRTFRIGRRFNHHGHAATPALALTAAALRALAASTKDMNHDG